MKLVLAKVAGSKMNVEQNYPTVGFFPKTIPRDPIDIDNFLEHVLLGQVLETLVSTDKLGNVTSGIAKSWLFSNDGKEITFKLDRNRRFSNGKVMDSDDVVYSIQRHLKNERSQSNDYLSSIKSIDAVGKNEVKITLYRKRVSLIKVLSREQLGIIPNGWKLNKDAKVPYIGSGPYTLKKESGEWFLEKNKYYKDFKNDQVKTWKLITGNVNKEFKKHNVTYLPFIAESTKEILEKEKTLSQRGTFLEQVSFVQSSLWWNPGGKNFKNEKLKKLIMSFLTELTVSNSKILKTKRATGVVPEGVLGHLDAEVEPNIISPVEYIKNASGDAVQFVVTVPSHIYNEHFSNIVKIKELEDKYRLKLKVIKVTLANRHDLNKEVKPDVIISRWAGGFNDPEGFLAILDKELNTDLEVYLEENSKFFSAAKTEDEWKVRADLFRKMGAGIIKNMTMIPAWKTPIYYYLNNLYKIESLNFRYTPRFLDVKIKQP